MKISLKYIYSYLVNLVMWIRRIGPHPSIARPGYYLLQVRETIIYLKNKSNPIVLVILSLNNFEKNNSIDLIILQRICFNQVASFVLDRLIQSHPTNYQQVNRFRVTILHNKITEIRLRWQNLWHSDAWLKLTTSSTRQFQDPAGNLQAQLELKVRWH